MDPAEASPVRSMTDIDLLRERIRGLADGGADLATIVESLMLEFPDVIDRPFSVAMALRQELGASVAELHLVVAHLAGASPPTRSGVSGGRW